MRSLRLPRSVRNLVPWLGLLAAGGLLYGAWAVVDGQRRAGEAREAEFAEQAVILWRAVGPYEGATRRQIEGAWNGGRSLEGHASVEAADLYFPGAGSSVFGGPNATQPALVAATGAVGARPRSFRAEVAGGAVDDRCGGWTVHLHFVNDHLVGARAIAPPRIPYTGPSASWHAVRLFARFVATGGAFVWAGCAVALPFNLRRRRPIAKAALAAGFLAAAGWSTDRAAAWLPDLVRERVPRALAWGGGATLLLAVIPARRWRGPDAPSPCAPCGRCGYDLTGNVSGVCPECGTLTPRGRINRWRSEAEQLDHVAETVDLAGPAEPTESEGEDSPTTGADGAAQDDWPPKVAAVGLLEGCGAGRLGWSSYPPEGCYTRTAGVLASSKGMRSSAVRGDECTDGSPAGLET